MDTLVEIFINIFLRVLGLFIATLVCIGFSYGLLSFLAHFGGSLAKIGFPIFSVTPNLIILSAILFAILLTVSSVDTLGEKLARSLRAINVLDSHIIDINSDSERHRERVEDILTTIADDINELKR